MTRAPRIETAEILSIGTELTVGDTRDTNATDLARDLTRRGVSISRIVTLPDRLDDVVHALREALGRAELATTTGGLGPTPDDLTREAIAAVVGETPSIDKELAARLRAWFAGRGVVMPEPNLKQAWLIPSATALPNGNGTAPAWWVDVPPSTSPDHRAGRVIVALPGPPREMRPIWAEQVAPRLEERGLGIVRVVRTLRLTGLGESQIAARLGDEILRATNPEVATYVRPDAVDVRIAAVAEPKTATRRPRSAADLADEAESFVLARLGEFVFARDDESWIDALGRRLARRTLALVEIGAGGALLALLGGAPWLAHGELLADEETARLDVRRLAEDARRVHRADVGLALGARAQGLDTAATVAVAVAGAPTHRETRLVLLRGEQGRQRAALAACAVLRARLGEVTSAR